MATITETGTIDLKAQKEAHDEAVSTAASDATSKANAAQSAAINAAASDATSKANAAAKTATDYITPDGTSTAAFHPEASSANQVKVDGTGVDIIKSGTSVAKYGEVARIGKESESRIELDFHSLKLIDKDGNTYLHISDLRDADGSATILETFIVDADTEISSNGTRFRLSYVIKTPIDDDNVVSVTVDGVTLNANEYDVSSPYYLRTYALLNLGQKVQIEYSTETAIRAFSFGQRASNSIVGAESFAEGRNNIASGTISHAEGFGTQAIGYSSHAEGYNTKASNKYSHAEGSSTQANNYASHAEGALTEASGDYAHAEGFDTQATGKTSHAEGYQPKATGEASHAEGHITEASNKYSHAEGDLTQATGETSHAEGTYTRATGKASHAQNMRTIASGEAQTAIGKWNVEDASGDLAFIIGNGASAIARSNAFTVDWDGNTSPSGNIELKVPTIDRDNPSSSVYDSAHGILLLDKDSEVIGLVRCLQLSDGRIGATIAAFNENTSGSQVNNSLNVMVDRNGASSYSMTDPAAFRSAIAAFSTSGGTITGPVHVKNTVIDRKVNPSSSQYSTDVGGDSSFQLRDKNGAVLGYIRVSKQTDGRTGLDLRVWNSDTAGNNVVNGAFQILIDRSGKVTYSIQDQANFRNAIGASSGIFPRSVGGTGMTARTTGTVTRSGITTAGTLNAYSNGVVCTVTGHDLVLKTALANGGNVNIATLPAGYRPPTNMYGTIHAGASSRNNKGFIRITSDGIVRFSNYSDASWATNYTIAFTITWAL